MDAWADAHSMAAKAITFLIILSTVSPQNINIGIITSQTDCLDFGNSSTWSVPQSQNFPVDLYPVCVDPQESFSVYTEYCGLLNKNISTLIISSALPSLESSIESYSETQLGLPVLRLSNRACDWSLSYASEESALWKNVMSAVLALSKQQNWSTVIIFYDSHHEHFKTSLSSQLWRHQGVTFTTISVDSTTQTLIKKYRHVFLHYPVFLVIASDHNVATVLQQVRMSNFDLLGQYYEWFIITSNYDLHKELQRSKVLHEGDNVALLSWKQKNMTEMVSQAVGDVMESIEAIQDNGEWESPMLKCGSRGTSGSWLTGAKLRGMLQDKASGNDYWNSTKIEIRTLVVDRKDGVRFDVAGQWNNEKGLTSSTLLYPDKIHGFNNRSFTVATVEYVPFTRKHPNGTWDGICFEILNELSRTMNFSYKVVEPPDGKFGIMYPDGNFTGMMKMIQDKVVDFGVNIFAIGSDRETIADFTTPFMVDPNVILMQKPDLASSKIFICLGPFSNVVWIMIALSVVVVGAILWIITFFHPLSRKPDFVDVGIYDPAINMWQVFGALMQQGMVFIPDFHSSRVLIAAWWFYTIIVVGTYNGNLIAFLTAPKVEMPVNTLKGLISSNMIFGIMRETEFHGNVMNAESGQLKDVWTKMTTDPAGPNRYLIDNPNDGLVRVLQDKNFAYIVEKSFYDTLRVKNVSFADKSCAFSRAKEDVSPFMYAFPFQKGSPYVRQFNLGILRILEAGLMQRWIRKWYSGGARCTGLERTTSQKNISLAEAQGAFYILAIGLVLALLVLISEKVLHWTKWFKSKDESNVNKNVQKGHTAHDLTVTHTLDSSNEGSNPVRNPIFGLSVEQLFGYDTSNQGRGRERSKGNQGSILRSFKNGCCFSVPSSRSASPQRSTQNGSYKMDDFYNVNSIVPVQNGHSSHDRSHEHNGLSSNGVLPAAVVHGLKRWQSDVRSTIKQADRETGEYL